MNPQARLEVYGQELNPETYAICRSDMMLKGQDASHIVHGNSFSDDGLAGERYDYLLANPPFGVEWKKVEKAVRDEHDTKGLAGRFGAGLPRINDGTDTMVDGIGADFDGLPERDAVGRTADIRRAHTVLEADLVASRQVDAENIANLANAGTSVTTLAARR